MVIETVFVSTALRTIGIVGSTLWVIPLILAGISYYNYDRLDPESPIINRKTLYKEYDFVIVGGGSAGAVVASRLSEIPSWNVLLLEAGPDENEISDVPSLAAYLQLSKLDWTYKTEPTGRACLGMKNGRCNWPRGKVLGGSSVLNYMLYVRGNKHDYDHWEAMGECFTFDRRINGNNQIILQAIQAGITRMSCTTLRSQKITVIPTWPKHPIIEQEVY
jgi:choline dehydrogenase-like flavoprotein